MKCALLLSCVSAVLAQDAGQGQGPIIAVGHGMGGEIPGFFEPNSIIMAAQQGPQTGTPIKKVIKPSFVLPVENYLYVSAFWIDQVVRINLEPRSRGQDEPPMITFAQGHGLDGPWGLAVRDGILFVASFTTDTIHRYSLETGEFVDFFGNEDELNCPEGIEFNERGELLVVSFLGDELVQYTEDGTFMMAVGKDYLKGPEDLTILLNGDVLVTSHFGDEIVRFTDNGAGGYMFAGRFAEVKAPVGLTRGPDGHVFTTSYVSNSVARHNWKTGEFIDLFASGGDLAGPAALAFASARVLYICSYENDKVLWNNPQHRSRTPCQEGGLLAISVKQHLVMSAATAESGLCFSFY